MKGPDPREWQRQQYWQGQGLLSRDLNDLSARQNNLRWWHNRSALHDAYGIVAGLQFDFDAHLRAATVSPGLAYDCFGRELLLCEPCTIALPEGWLTSDGLTLLIAYPEDQSTAGLPGAAGACLPSPCKPSQPCRLLKWQSGGQISIRDGVALGRVQQGPHGPEKSATFRPYPTRRLARPHIANGATTSGGTPWRPWTISLGGDRAPLLVGLETPVDTSKAAFVKTPCYFAWHQGSLWQISESAPLFRVFAQSLIFTNARFRAIGAANDLSKMMQLLNGILAHIAEPEPDTFLYRIWLPFLGQASGQGIGAEQLALFARQLTVCWLGIQPLVGASEEDHGDIERNRFC